jgi:hypothetical protein
MSSPWPPETSTPALPIARPATTADGEGLQAAPNPPLPEDGASSRVEANCDWFATSSVGMMGPQDGIDHAVRALAALRRRRDDWHAILVGDGDVLEEMRALAAALG